MKQEKAEEMVMNTLVQKQNQNVLKKKSNITPSKLSRVIPVVQRRPVKAFSIALFSNGKVTFYNISVSPSSDEQWLLRDAGPHPDI